jgi:hypothetical protein
VGSIPASRTNKIKDLRQMWRKSFFFARLLRDFHGACSNVVGFASAPPVCGIYQPHQNTISDGNS